MTLPLVPAERSAAVRQLVAIFGSVNDLIAILDENPLDPALARARVTRDMIGELVTDLAGTGMRKSA
ncbi:hypothetical protein [Nocardia macrotermitis]|uniref:Uncharacterized protein n=1 Tax=Nocardia macrotermitis TaxID=2585198 RepID=A0A7K0D0U1_9NOCA|nr:hypothetical protein [Nocardia macrotermitis]MQY18554.1 hypothetical protein [Nocardia macrotermitis]